MLAVILVASGFLEAGPNVRADLQTVAQRSIWFAHQSVGKNLIDGVAELAAEAGVPLRIAEGPPSPATFAHAFIPENGDPSLKIRGFAAAPLPSPGIAVLKLCYADFDAATDARALFAQYQAALAEQKARHPGTTFVHVTTPLTTVQGGPKAWVKRVLGRPRAGVAENARREEYNGLLRAAYAGKEPLFDLAALESARPDGTRETSDWNGRAIAGLVPAYTTDGGHLDPAARRRMASMFLSVLASAPVQAEGPRQPAAPIR